MAARTPFHKLLIANRGEIAMRVMRSAARMGYRTVAVHSTADAAAAHVQAADEAIAIGAPSPAESYLRIDRLIDAARRSGADAIHPGYGFLAENAQFSQACADADIVFVGPSPAAIRAMGDKAGAKQRLLAAGVPCIPGYLGEDQSDARLFSEAQRIGFPVMIKATAGGGGRGLRLVQAPDEFATLLRAARSEARGAFADDGVLLERAIADPRHVEIQIIGDRLGNVIHLGERDCSVQRRHQKIIEEAPSPGVGPELRARMGAAAVAAARAIDYEGAGTVEFLLDPAGDFYFMEMNTRLQVEHPVTEAITGLDLVELQLRVAAGEELPLTQQQVRFDGHAIEVRLCAEDPAAGFLPQSGRLELWRPSQALRVEHGLRSADDIPAFYDSMMAKLVAHGRDRADAVRRLEQGLAATVALGVRTNQAFLGACLRHPVFAAGAATTSFIGRHQAELLSGEMEQASEVVAIAAAILHAGHDAALAHGFTAPLRLALGATIYAVALTQRRDGGCHCDIGGRRFDLQLPATDAHDLLLCCDGVTRSVVQVRRGETLHLHYAGRAWSVRDLTYTAAHRASQSGGDGRLRASMNGRVVDVAVSVGDAVTAGQAILTLEAMKMEHIHAAPIAGRVALLAVTVGDQVSADRVVAQIEPEGS